MCTTVETLTELNTMSSMEIDKATLDAELLEGCPSLAPRPNARNIKELEDQLVDHTVTSYPAAQLLHLTHQN